MSVLPNFQGLFVAQCLNRIETRCTDGRDHAADQTYERQNCRRNQTVPGEMMSRMSPISPCLARAL